MTNTPMTFEEWFASKQTDYLDEEYHYNKEGWEACEAQQKEEIESLKTDLDGYMKASHEYATEIVQQSQLIAELVEALESLKEMQIVEQEEIIAKALAKVKGGNYG